MRLKFIVIREEDQNKLHRFLNQESEKGWHATKISFFHIRFDYDPNVRYYYEVFSDHITRTIRTGPNTLKQHEDFMNDFNYTLVPSRQSVIVYRSLEKQDLYTGESVDIVVSKKIFKRLFKNQLLLLMIILLNIGSTLNQGLYSIMVSNLAQIALLFLLFFVIQQVIKTVSLVNDYKRQKLSDKLNIRWHPYFPDPYIVYLALLLLGLLSILIPDPLFGIAIIVPALLIIPIQRFIQRRNPTTPIKIIIYLISFILITILSLNIMMRSVFTLTPKGFFITESWLAKETTDYRSFTSIESLEIKTELFNDILVDGFLKKNHIPTDIDENAVHKIENEYGMVRYVFRNSSKIVITEGEKPLEFYESYPNTNKGR